MEDFRNLYLELEFKWQRGQVRYTFFALVHARIVPGCSNRSNKEAHLLDHCLPLRKKQLLKVWIRKINGKSIPNQQRVSGL